MRNILFLALLLCTTARLACAQSFFFPKLAGSDTTALGVQVPHLAKQMLERDHALSPTDLFRLQILAGEYSKALITIKDIRKTTNSELSFLQYELYACSKANKQTSFGTLLDQKVRQLSDKDALSIAASFISRNGTEGNRRELDNSLAGLKDSVSHQEALAICKSYFVFDVFRQIEPVATTLFLEDDNRRYHIQDSVMIKTPEGFTLSAVVVRKKDVTTPQPTALLFFMYANTAQSLYEAKQSAANGYVGVVADVRGKRLSPDAVAPYENEVTDVNAVIDWINRQEWSNGKVGMYGGSYSGFAQWAAIKNLHPALKTIVPYVAAIPGLGLPMENNIFITPNYGWAFYVTNNKHLDNEVYNDPQRWSRMQDNWYASGAAYNKIDSVDGTPNPWLQKWLKHSSFDRYWQDMIPYKEDFSRINIPVLNITGYYDDGQISAIQYLKEHYKYNPQADHHLIIGPYDHFGAQQGGTPVLRGYEVDPVALINTRELTYQWLDYVLKGKEKPTLVKDKINYQVMGANVWKHASTLEELNAKNTRFYLTDIRSDKGFKLSSYKPAEASALHQEVDFKDRSSSTNEYYPYPIIKEELDRSSGLFFLSDTLTEDAELSGTFSGELKASINKKDMDIGVILYEVLPDGRYFCLSYYLGRASYAEDMSIRKLLIPGKKETIPFERTRMVSRRLSKGSRLLVVLNINKNSGAQINYGTGKDVSEETVADAQEPLKIKWYTDSFITLPLNTIKEK